MPRIFDNIDLQLLPALRDTMAVSARVDFCVGYFNLRGWKAIADLVERWPGGDGGACRLLVGMQKNPDEELREALRVDQAGLDTQTAIRLRRQLAQQFREQLTFGPPTNADEVVLQQLARQLRARKVVVKLFLRHGLHAKLYLLHRGDKVNPMTAFVGSSNLTFSGLEKQGELNVDVFDHDACAETPALPHAANHHEVVDRALHQLADEMKPTSAGGQLGSRTGVRRRLYERLRQYADAVAASPLSSETQDLGVRPEALLRSLGVKGTLFDSKELAKAIDDIYRSPLRQSASDTLGRQLRSGVSDSVLVELVLALREDDRLTISHDDREHADPQIICSLGLRSDA